MFAKVFAQILDSSIAEDYRIRLVFEDFLKLADKHGVVDMTKESIARRTNVPLEIVTMAIDSLQMPDPSSRTHDMEGRRITLLDDHRSWGWKIVNFTKYRESATKEMLRMGEAERKAEWRKRKGFKPTTDLVKNQSTETDAEADKSRVRPDLSVTNSGQKPDCPRNWNEVSFVCSTTGYPEEDGRAFFDHFESTGWIDKNGHPVVKWKSKLATWVRNAQANAHEKKSKTPYEPNI